MAATTTTISGNTVRLLVPEYELTDTQKEQAIEAYDDKYPEAALVHHPTTRYNCHSYAWYLAANTNPYWIIDIEEFRFDPVCVQVADTDIQLNDIVIYIDAQGDIVHSAMVDNIDENGNLILISKWGVAGVYRHYINYVPDSYKSNPATNQVSCIVLRYHDYANKYTGNEYHSGKQHFYEYADVCLICEDTENRTWRVNICKGPPCVIPALSHDEDEEVQ